MLDAPIISDLEYDRLLNELKKIETDRPDWVTPDSPTQRAGARPADRFEKIRHPAAIPLANAFGGDDARAWLERIKKIDDRVEQAKFVVEPKIDGLWVDFIIEMVSSCRAQPAAMVRSERISLRTCERSARYRCGSRWTAIGLRP